MGHLQEVGSVCQLGGRGSVCGPFQSGWVKYEIQLPGFILVYGTQPCCTAGDGGGVYVCVCVECAETTVGITGMSPSLMAQSTLICPLGGSLMTFPFWLRHRLLFFVLVLPKLE